MRALIVVALLLPAVLAGCASEADAPSTADGTGDRAATATGDATQAPDAGAESGGNAVEGDDATAEATRWAAEVCAAINAFDRATAAASDGLNPRDLTLDERKERAQRLNDELVAVASAAAERVEGASPPPGGELFHATLLEQFREIAAALEDQTAAVLAAEEPDDIETANVEANLRVSEATQRVQGASLRLPPEVVEVLQRVAVCAAIGV